MKPYLRDIEPKPTHSRRRLGIGLVILAAALGVGCAEGPAEVEFEVIEETTFAASLDIDLSAMQRLSTGVYRQDLEVGTGEELAFGDFAQLAYTGWLADGTQFDTGEFGFLMGGDQVVSGLEDGMLGMMEEGIRRLIIPPSRGYGGLGNGPVPPGAIMVFEVELLDVTKAPAAR